MAKYTEMVLNGHGGWNLKDAPAWAQVPRGTSIKFLNGNMELLLAIDIKDDDTAMRLLEQFRNGEVAQEGTEYKYVPNYTLSDDGVTGAPDWVYKVSSDTALCTNDGSDPSVVCDSGIHRCDGLFADPDLVGATLYWGACRFVQLNEVGDQAWKDETGVNEPGVPEKSDDEILAFVEELEALPADQQDDRWKELQDGIYQAGRELNPRDWERVQELFNSRNP